MASKKKHKIIICLVSLVIGLPPWILFLCLTGINSYTGDGVFNDVVGYLLLLSIMGGLTSSIMAVVGLTTWYFIHRKDPRLLQRNYFPSYNDEQDIIIPFCFSSGYVATAITLLILGIRNYLM